MREEEGLGVRGGGAGRGEDVDLDTGGKIPCARSFSVTVCEAHCVMQSLGEERVVVGGRWSVATLDIYVGVYVCMHDVRVCVCVCVCV